MVRSAYFAARALKVETDADGSKWVTVQFAAGPLSQTEAVSIRLNDDGCAHPAFLTGTEGSKFISAACATGPHVPDGDALWLEEPGKPLVRCYHFMGPAV